MKNTSKLYSHAQVLVIYQLSAGYPSICKEMNESKSKMMCSAVQCIQKKQIN